MIRTDIAARRRAERRIEISGRLKRLAADLGLSWDEVKDMTFAEFAKLSEAKPASTP